MRSIAHFFNQDLRRSVANPVIAAPNWRFGARLSAKRFGMEEKMQGPLQNGDSLRQCEANYRAVM